MGTLEVRSEGGGDQLVTYIAGVRHELEPSDSPVVVTSAALHGNLTGGLDVTGDPLALSPSGNQLFLRMDGDGSLVASTGKGASVSIILENGFLRLTTTLPDTFKDMTSGLLGVFNDDPGDDFRDRNGTILRLSNESEIYEQFGLLCKFVRWNMAKLVLC